MNGDSPLPLVLVTHYFPGKGGGVEIVAFELARRLTQARAAQVTWLASDTVAAPNCPQIEFRPIRTWNVCERRFGFPWPIWSPACVFELWRAIGAAQVVHLHDALYMGNILAACIAKLRGKSLLVTQHVGLVPYRSPLLRRLMKFANRWVAGPVLRSADCAVFISEQVLSYYSEICRWKQQPYLVPNGVDTELFRPPTPAERQAARAALSLAEGAMVFIFVGRFVEKKGLGLLRELAAATPASPWIFAGEGPLDPQRWDLPNVRVYRGRRRETLRELLWGADLLVLPSVGEGFPLVIQESMACGLPSLASTDALDGCASVKEILPHEALGAAARERWLARLEAISRGVERLPERGLLAGFACRQWSWQDATHFYVQRCLSLTRESASG